MEELLTAVTITTGLGLTFASVLAVANHFLKVWEDPRLGRVSEMLPGNNCGACGVPGCNAFAEVLVKGEASPSGCTVADEGTLNVIAEFLGVDVGGADPLVARLACGGGLGRVQTLANYQGMESCRATALVDGGGQACNWGCLGLADCEAACTFDAISMNQHALPTVTPSACTACGDCVSVCPQDLFSLVPMSRQLWVQCKAPLAGEEARSMCSAACDACGRCASDAPEGTVTMKNNLPIIQWNSDLKPGPEATWRCPTGAIQWLQGQQFQDPEQGWEDEAWRLRA